MVRVRHHSAALCWYDKFVTPLEPGALTRFFLTAARYRDIV